MRNNLDPLNLVVYPAHVLKPQILALLDPFWPFKGPFGSSSTFFSVSSLDPMRNHMDPFNLVVDPANV